MKDPRGQSPFFGTESLAVTAEARRKHPTAFALADEVVEYMNWKSDDLTASTGNLQQVLIVSLLPRLFTAFQACVLCCERGLEAEAFLTARKVVELTFKIVAISKSRDAARRYVKSDEVQRRNALKKLKSLQTVQHPTKTMEEIDRLHSEAEQKVRAEQLHEMNTRDFAKDADLLDWYNTAYAYFSISAHANVRDLESILEKDATGEIETVRYGPELNLQSSILATAAESAILSLEASTTVMRSGAVGVRTLRRKLVLLAEELSVA